MYRVKKWFKKKRTKTLLKKRKNQKKLCQTVLYLTNTKTSYYSFLIKNDIPT